MTCRVQVLSLGNMNQAIDLNTLDHSLISVSLGACAWEPVYKDNSSPYWLCAVQDGVVPWQKQWWSSTAPHCCCSRPMSEPSGQLHNKGETQLRLLGSCLCPASSQKTAGPSQRTILPECLTHCLQTDGNVYNVWAHECRNRDRE